MAIAHVIDWVGAQGNTVTTVTTAPIDTTGANFIAAQTTYSGTFTSIADSKSNTYANAVPAFSNGGDNVRLDYKESAAVGASHTITVTAGSFVAVDCTAYSGLNASTTLDKTATGTGTSTTLTSGTTATTAQADELLLVGGTISDGVSSSFTAGGSFAMHSQVGRADIGTVGFIEGRIVAATGTYNGLATWGGSSNAWAAFIATFKGTAAAADTLMAQNMY